MNEPRTVFPQDYWNTAKHSPYWHSKTDTWAVCDNYPTLPLDPVMIGLDKPYAYIIACILNGDLDLAKVLIGTGVWGNPQNPRISSAVVVRTYDTKLNIPHANA